MLSGHGSLKIINTIIYKSQLIFDLLDVLFRHDYSWIFHMTGIENNIILLQNMMNTFDINYKLLQQQHPYHSSGLCLSNKFLRESCEASKYDLLQLWCWPEQSIQQIKNKLPKINFDDVVKLALVYNPIPESLRYYDGLNLFYHSCVKGQDHPEIFLEPLLSDIYGLSKFSTYTDSIYMICYKYNYPQVLKWLLSKKINKESLSDIEIAIEACNVRNGNNYKTFNGIPKFGARVFTTIFERVYILDPEEMLEFMFVMKALKVNPMTINLFWNKYYDSLVDVIDRDRVTEIGRKYDPNFQRPSGPHIFDVEKIRDTRLSVYADPNPKRYSHPQLLLVSGLAEQVIPKAHLGTFYANTGKFDMCVNWRKSHISSNISGTTIFCSIYGLTCSNIFTDKKEGKHIPDIPQYSHFDPSDLSKISFEPKESKISFEPSNNNLVIKPSRVPIPRVIARVRVPSYEEPST